MASRDWNAPSGSARVVAILLAARRSQRMGNRNKLLLEAGGQPMVRRAADTLLESRVCGVIAVFGHDHRRVAEALVGLPLRTGSIATMLSAR